MTDRRKIGTIQIPRLLVAVLIVAAVSSAAALAFDAAVDSRVSRQAAELSGAAKQPVPSRNLTVTILPLEASEHVRSLLPSESDVSAAAAQLAGADGQAELIANLEQLYPFSYEVADPLTIPDELFDVERRQYNIDKLLTWMLRQRDPRSFKTVGVLSVDVYEPGYNFLFGLAKLGGPGCVASTARMGQTAHTARLEPAERWHLLVRHELGHSLGLQHTEEPDSVMHYSNSLAELDRSSPELTASDWRTLRNVLPVQWRRD
jgi:archaemetzincin